MSHYHLYAIGNALVDSEYYVTDAQLKTMGVDKRHMTLIDSARRAELLHHLADIQPRRSGGGSAGNTVVALAVLGGKAFYSCRVADDELGDFYAEDLLDNGVATNLTHTRPEHGQTGSCMVFVTPDAERSMCTYLGTTAELEAGALHAKDIAKSKIYYMEGYLAASPTGLDAALKGRQLAKDAGAALAVTLSDVSMIKFCRAGLEAMIGDGLDYLFCNEEEAMVWCDTQDFAETCSILGRIARIVCITLGPKGCAIVEQGRATEVGTATVKALDTNGAGDMFAGAFLYAVTHGHSSVQAAQLANQACAAVVSIHGNRLTRDALEQVKARFLASC